MKYENIKIKDLEEEFPYVGEYFEANQLELNKNLSLRENVENLDQEKREDLGLLGESIFESLNDFIKSMNEFLGIKEKVRELVILPGIDKDKKPEKFEKIVLRPSDIVAIVGPTGSGKSRFLADIEWMAKKDTPTKRTILIDGKEADEEDRFHGNHKLVAQLSQNMNFIMDLTVKEFIELHAKARFIEAENVIDKIIEDANKLAGEKFSLNTYLTSLSGGQSRALMISDTANLSESPIVLIDEIENAGIDRKEAVKLLISKDKIVLMATHDPTLALMAKRRIVINNGAVQQVIEREDEELKVLKELDRVDKYVEELRNNLRYGKKLK